MTRCLGLLLILALLLCGCAGNTSEPTAPDENDIPPIISEHPGSYVPDSAMEQATNGAICAFQTEKGSDLRCAMLGNELVLICTQNGEGSITLYREDDLQKVKTVYLGQRVTPAPEQMQFSEKGIGYYDAVAKAVVFLNTDLLEIGRMYLPETICADAWLSPDWQNVYYCTDQGIWEMDLQTGISRLLKEQKAAHQQITGCLAEGKVLRYVFQSADGSRQTQLIDSQTGLTLYDGNAFGTLTTLGTQYYWPVNDRGVAFLRFGDAQTNRVLWSMEENAQPYMLFLTNAMVLVQQKETEATLTYYDLHTGRRMAVVTMPNVVQVWSVQDDGAGGVWLLAEDTSADTMLYKWDPDKSRLDDPTDYTAAYYDRETPDSQSLAQLIQNGNQIGKRFGVDVLIWKDALTTVPGDWVFTEEHITQLYDCYLPRLEQALSVFPEGFFQKSKGKLQIALVRDICGKPEWGTLSQAEQVQYWSNGTPVVAVTLGENFEQNLFHGIYLYMETRILSRSTALYEWNRLNPAGFSYDNHYITNLERTDTAYVEGENPYFIDLFSMSYAKEDRARIFEYACTPGNEDLFQAPVLQEKLRRICKGIREAYGLKKAEATFLWEQYLL